MNGPPVLPSFGPGPWAAVEKLMAKYPEVQKVSTEIGAETITTEVSHFRGDVVDAAADDQRLRDASAVEQRAAALEVLAQPIGRGRPPPTAVAICAPGPRRRAR